MNLLTKITNDIIARTS